MKQPQFYSANIDPVCGIAIPDPKGIQLTEWFTGSQHGLNTKYDGLGRLTLIKVRKFVCGLNYRFTIIHWY